MFDVSRRTTAIRLSILAGAAALTLGGLTASARAFPAAPIGPVGAGAETVRYDGDGYPHHLYRHHRYGENFHPRHPGHAGLYDCGPGGKSTRLSRKACGGHDRFGHLYRY